jgi:hydrogenase maturation factor
MNLIELQEKIHAQNVELGWWDEERPFDVFVCLFHSELSEAMEGDRKGLMDDHLPQYPMFKVEMADYVIRVLDWFGGNNIVPNLATIEKNKNASNCQFIAHCHNVTSEAFVEMLEENTKAAAKWLMYGVGIAIHAMGDEAEKIILEKVEYNKHRADHKRENRAKEGGKKY